MGSMLRPVLLLIGAVALGLGILGMFVPILPTTPFLLLAAYCFARSSKRLHRWLVGHPRLGTYVVGLVYGGAIPRRAKRTALLALWPGITASVALVVWRVGDARVWAPVSLAIIAIAVAVTWYILSRPDLDPPS
ncbi:MAG TPA: YbaN family protein [Coriobacteriia bacterium]|nr:YbaN family protein [Coriobacteriia bacterium]